MTSKQRFKATIDGKQYIIVSDHSNEHILAVVDIINQQLNQLKELDPGLSKEDRSILMAINAVSDQLVKEDQIASLEEDLDTLTSPGNTRETDTPRVQAKVPFERPEN